MNESDLQTKVDYLTQKVLLLEQENVATTNALYEMENRLQAQLDALTNYTMFNREKLEEIHGN